MVLRRVQNSSLGRCEKLFFIGRNTWSVISVAIAWLLYEVQRQNLRGRTDSAWVCGWFRFTSAPQLFVRPLPVNPTTGEQHGQHGILDSLVGFEKSLTRMTDLCAIFQEGHSIDSTLPRGSRTRTCMSMSFSPSSTILWKYVYTHPRKHPHQVTRTAGYSDRASKRLATVQARKNSSSENE